MIRRRPPISVTLDADQRANLRALDVDPDTITSVPAALRAVLRGWRNFLLFEWHAWRVRRARAAIERHDAAVMPMLNRWTDVTGQERL